MKGLVERLPEEIIKLVEGKKGGEQLAGGDKFAMPVLEMDVVRDY